MTRVVLVSRTLARLTLEKTTTSSQSYELQLAIAFSATRLTTVVSLAANEDVDDDNLRLVGLKSKTNRLAAAARLLRELLRRRNRGAEILAFGYDPLLILPLVAARAVGARVFSMVFDTHRASTLRMPLAKRLFVDAYFGLGQQLLRALSGLLVVTPDAQHALSRLNPNVFLTRIGFSKGGVPWTDPYGEVFNVIYAGALEPYNGIREMMDAVVSLNESGRLQRPVVLRLHGAGSLARVVSLYASRYDDILYGGLAAKDTVDAEVRRSHLALNLRDLDHPVSSFAFPSKLVDLLGTGVPVVSTAVLPEALLSRYALVVRSVNSESVAEALVRAQDGYDVLKSRAQLAREYVASEFDQGIISSEILAFLGGQRVSTYA